MPSKGEPFFCAPWVGYRTSSDEPPSDGWIEVEFHGDQVTAAQARTAAALPRRAAALHDTIVDAVVHAYPHLVSQRPRPASATRASLCEGVRLRAVIVMNDEYEDEAYAAYRLVCSWHTFGVAVVTHKDRIVAVGAHEILRYPVADAVRGAQPPPPMPSDKERAAIRASAVRAALRNPVGFEFADEELVVVFPCWAGFAAGPKMSASGGASTGKALVSIVWETEVEEDAQVPLQRAAYRHAIEHAETMQAILLDAIGDAHPDVRPLYDHLELAAVLIHQVEKDEVAYVGYQFRCAWDKEHGVGVMMHGERVVAVGGADTAIVSDAAELDCKPAKSKAPRKRAAKKTPAKKTPAKKTPAKKTRNK